MKIDPVSNQIYTANGDYDESTGEPLFSVTEINRDNGEVYTKVGKVDPKTGRLVIVRVYMVNKRDERGKSTEVDLKSVEYDPRSGRIMNIVGGLSTYSHFFRNLSIIHLFRSIS